MQITITTTGLYPYNSTDILDALREAIKDHARAYGVEEVECEAVSSQMVAH